MKPTKEQIYDCFNYGLHETPTYRESILQNAYKEAFQILEELQSRIYVEGVNNRLDRATAEKWIYAIHKVRDKAPKDWREK